MTLKQLAAATVAGSIVLAAWIAGIDLARSGSRAVAAPPAGDDAADKDYSGELPRIPSTTPTDAMKTFELQPGFRLDQLAAEPLVADPVAVAFDENGKLYVVEMRGYSENAAEKLSVIRVLEDTNDDGQYEKSTVFLEGLNWPTAIACWEGGVFIADAPDLFYAKDTDGDGVCDERRPIYSGFGVSNVQGLVNSFLWGFDNRIHVACSSTGGAIKSLVDPDHPAVEVRGHDLAFDPRSFEFRATSGGQQHGMTFDRWGNRYVCGNSDHAILVVFDDRYIARNPYLAAPGAKLSIAADGGQAEVFRLSPVEPWRIVRTRLRAKGIVPGLVEGGGRPAGYFTGATGFTVYRGDAFPEEYRGNAFVGDVGSNLVHRKRLEPEGVVQIARRADAGREFLASRDIWFRPVQFANAPDGCLYVLDMSREVIEHPASIPPIIKKHIDLTSGRDQGRIYRVAPEGFRQPKQPRLGKATTAELVALLDHPNGWHRDTAGRLLYQKQDRAAVGPLEKLAHDAKLPEGRIAALWALQGLGALRAESVLAVLSDEHPRVREHAVRLAEEVAGDSPEVRKMLLAMTSDEDVRVRYQLAFTLGELTERGRYPALAEIARRDGGDKWMRLAVLSSVGEGAGEVLALLAADAKYRATPAGIELLETLARQIGARNAAADVALLLKALPPLAADAPATAQAVLRGATQGAGQKHKELTAQLAAATGGQATALLAELVEKSLAAALDDKLAPDVRAQAVRSLGIATAEKVREPLTGLIDPRQPHEVQLAALATLGQYDEPEIGTDLLEAFPTLSPRLRNEALETLLARPAWTKALLAGVAAGSFAPANVDAARVRLLREHPDEAIRTEARRVFAAQQLSKRADVIAAYRGALEMKGDAERGRAKFRQVCAACHRLEGFGHEIGLNLAAIRNRGPETILLSVLDPNREVDPKYVNYVAVLDDGRSASGILASETATSVTLKRAENATDTLLRVEIEALRSTGISIMPEGLEKQIDPAALADVIAYLMSIQ